MHHSMAMAMGGASSLGGIAIPSFTWAAPDIWAAWIGGSIHRKTMDDATVTNNSPVSLWGDQVSGRTMRSDGSSRHGWARSNAVGTATACRVELGDRLTNDQEEPITDYNFLHDGTTDWAICYRVSTPRAASSQYLCATYESSATQPVGTLLNIDPVNGRCFCQVYGKIAMVSTNLGTALSPDAVFSTNEPVDVYVAYVAATRTLTVEANGSAGTPVVLSDNHSLDDATEFTFGADSNGSGDLQGDIAGVVILKEIPSAERKAEIFTELANGNSSKTLHRVLHIGDSMTANVRGREYVARRYEESGTHDYISVGSIAGATEVTNNFDHENHEGVSGERTDEIATRVATALGTTTGVGAGTATIAIIQCGTNNAIQNVRVAEAVDDIQDIVDDCAAAGIPAARIIVMKLPAATDGTVNARIDSINTDLDTLTGCTVVNRAGTITISGDGIHPTSPTGYYEMAEAWADALLAA